MTVIIVPVAADDPRVAPLIATHVAAVDADPHTPPEARHRLDLSGLLDPRITFFGGFDVDAVDEVPPDAPAVAIGAYAHRAHEWGEVKSMHVEASCRRRGIATLMLEAIITAGRERGVTMLRLETSRRFDAAIGLYRTAGFTECGAFGDYADHPASMFMEMSLARHPRRADPPGLADAESVPSAG